MRLLLLSSLIFIGCQGNHYDVSGDWKLVGGSCEAEPQLNITRSPEGLVTLKSNCTILTEDAGSSLVVLQSDCGDITNGQTINYTVYEMLHLSYKVDNEVCSVTYTK